MCTGTHNCNTLITVNYLTFFFRKLREREINKFEDTYIRLSVSDDDIARGANLEFEILHLRMCLIWSEKVVYKFGTLLKFSCSIWLLFRFNKFGSRKNIEGFIFAIHNPAKENWGAERRKLLLIFLTNQARFIRLSRYQDESSTLAIYV